MLDLEIYDGTPILIELKEEEDEEPIEKVDTKETNLDKEQDIHDTPNIRTCLVHKNG